MVLVRKVQKRGANIVVEAHGEVEFLPGGDVEAWCHRFSQRARSFAAKEAPSNERPRWKHYGKPLKSTMRASTRPRTVLLKGGNVMRVYSAVGSTAPYAYYVDQGTGIHNGSAPWEAKILPPREEGSPSLYEKRWFPALYSPEVRQSAHRGAAFAQSRPVMIKGQEGKHFFDKALARTFRYMRVYGSGGVVANLSAVLATMPTGMDDFAGNTPVTDAFKASLREWRIWRDAAYMSDRTIGTPEKRARRRAAVEAAWQAADAKRRATKAERERQRQAKRRPKSSPDVADPRFAAENKKRIMQAKRKQAEREKAERAAEMIRLRERSEAIQREIDDLTAQARAKYKRQGLIVSVERVRKGGTWYLVLTLRKPGSPKPVTLEFTSDYQ